MKEKLSGGSTLTPTDYYDVDAALHWLVYLLCRLSKAPFAAVVAGERGFLLCLAFLCLVPASFPFARPPRVWAVELSDAAVIPRYMRPWLYRTAAHDGQELS